MRLKTLLSGTAAAMVALTASQLVIPSPATAATGHFVRLSNKHPAVVQWCVEARDKNNQRISGDCDYIPVRKVGTFDIPVGADHVAVMLTDGGGAGRTRYFNPHLPNNKDWCFRFTISGTTHEALDKPCKK